MSIIYFGHLCLYVSKNRGDTWDKLQILAEQIIDFDVAEDNSVHAYTNSDYIYSEDHFETFTKRNHDNYIQFLNGQVIEPVYFFRLAGIPNIGGKILGGGNCSEFIPGVTLHTVNNGKDWISESGISDIHENYIFIKDKLYGFDNKFRPRGISLVSESDLSSQKVFPDLPNSVYVVDENLIHFNQNEIDGFSYVMLDSQSEEKKLNFGPEGRIFKGKGYEGTYVAKGRTLYNNMVFYRDSLSSIYKNIDLSALSNNIRFLDSDFEGNCFISTYDSKKPSLINKIFLIENTIQHPQTITGQIFIDADEDCTYDNDEIFPEYNWKVILSGGDTDLIQYTSDGQFDFHVPLGDYSITVINDSNQWSFCDTVYNLSVNAPNEIVDINIPVQTVTECADIQLTMDTPFLRRCFPSSVTIVAANNGNRNTENIEVLLSFDRYLKLNSCSEEFEFVNDTMIRILIEEVGFQEKQTIGLVFTPSCDSNLGQLHCLSAKLNNANSCNNSNAICSDIYLTNIGAYDPNDMRVFNNSGHEAIKFEADDYQYYKVRFQNTGTDTAFNVRVVTSLSDSIDMTSLQFLGASHDYIINSNDANNLVVEFPNIMLPDSSANNADSNGFFNFKVKTIKDVVVGTEINGFTDIYFDYNAPIRTNETLAIIIEESSCDQPIYQYIQKDLCPGERYDGIWYTSFYNSWRCSKSGCDTLLAVDLTSRPTESTIIRTNACEGQVIDGITDNTNVRDTLQSVYGCDSIVTTQYRFLPYSGDYAIIDTSICSGESFQEYTKTGIYTESIVGTISCSIKEIRLLVEESYNIQIDTMICEGEAFMGFTISGTYVVGDTTVAGCDSLMSINLEVLPSDDLLCSPTSTNTIDDSLDIELFPNPATNECSIKINGNLIIQKLELYNSIGQRVISKNNPIKRLDISHLSDGQYWLKILHKNGFLYKPLLKQ